MVLQATLVKSRHIANSKSHQTFSFTGFLSTEASQVLAQSFIISRLLLQVASGRSFPVCHTNPATDPGCSYNLFSACSLCISSTGFLSVPTRLPTDSHTDACLQSHWQANPIYLKALTKHSLPTSNMAWLDQPSSRYKKKKITCMKAYSVLTLPRLAKQLSHWLFQTMIENLLLHYTEYLTLKEHKKTVLTPL